MSKQSLLRGWAVVLLALVVSGCGSPDETFERILRLEDGRAAASDFAGFVASRRKAVRARAAQALAKLQDTTSYNLQVDLLSDDDAEVRAWAAFGLGQLGLARAQAVLLERLGMEPDSTVRLELLDALGKVGADSALAVLRGLLRDSDAVVRAQAALSIARLALRGKKDSLASTALIARLQDKNDGVRWRSAYALWRIGFPPAGQELLRAIGDENPLVRMFAVRGLGALADAAAVEPLAELLRSDTDWRVRVDAARALGRFPLKDVLPRLTVRDANLSVRLAAIEALGRSGMRARRKGEMPRGLRRQFRRKLREILSPQAEIHPWQEVAEALVAAGRGLGKEFLPLAERYLSYPHRRVRARLAAALGETGAPDAAPLLVRLYDENQETLIRIAVLEAFTQLDPPAATPIYLRALQEGDVVLTALAVRGLAADSSRGRRYLPQMLAAVTRLPQPMNIEAAEMIFRAFGQLGDARVAPFLEDALRVPDKVYAGEAAAALETITGKSYRDRLPQRNASPFRWSYADVKKALGKRAVIITAKGSIEVELLADQAPLTVLNFIRLARAGFYDGLSFHRVVPNFVIQGGDPRGDLWGEPGYSIRSEFNRYRYLRGSVGMASAGKDTEGCQFFITHSPQPHLDGRYTVFGRVISGQDVVDRIQSDDRIVRIAVR